MSKLYKYLDNEEEQGYLLCIYKYDNKIIGLDDNALHCEIKDINRLISSELVVGFLSFCIDKYQKQLCVLDIYIKEMYQSQGIGERVLKSIKRLAKRKGCIKSSLIILSKQPSQIVLSKERI